MNNTDAAFLRFSLSLFDLDQSISRLKILYCRQAGLKPVHVLWILLLEGYPEGISASRLSQLAHIDKALVSRELKSLISIGLVMKKNENLMYNSPLVLTPEGKKKALLIKKVTSQIIEDVHGIVTPQELDCFYRVCSLLTESFSRKWAELSSADTSVLPDISESEE